MRIPTALTSDDVFFKHGNNVVNCYIPKIYHTKRKRKTMIARILKEESDRPIKEILLERKRVLPEIFKGDNH